MRPISRTPNIFQLSTYLKSSTCIAKTIFHPINKDHPTNSEVQSDKKKKKKPWKSVILFNVLFQTKNY